MPFAIKGAWHSGRKVGEGKGRKEKGEEEGKERRRREERERRGGGGRRGEREEGERTIQLSINFSSVYFGNLSHSGRKTRRSNTDKITTRDLPKYGELTRRKQGRGRWETDNVTSREEGEREGEGQEDK